GSSSGGDGASSITSPPATLTMASRSSWAGSFWWVNPARFWQSWINAWTSSRKVDSISPGPQDSSSVDHDDPASTSCIVFFCTLPTLVMQVPPGRMVVHGRKERRTANHLNQYRTYSL